MDSPCACGGRVEVRESGAAAEQRDMEQGMQTGIVGTRHHIALSDGLSFSQVRRQLTLNEMVEREVDAASGKPTTLRTLFDYWQSQRVGGIVPASAFDPKGLFTPEAFRWVACIDVRHADPMDFVFKSHPGFLSIDLTGRALRDYPHQTHARNVALEYLTCKMIQQPSYYEISQQIGTVRRTYTRLLLPVAGRRRPLTRLYYASRYTQLEIDGKPAALT